MRRSTTLVAGVIAALALMLAPAATAAISTNDMNSLTASDLANALVGSGVSVSNATFSGSNVAGGTFAGGASAIGFESGIILSSGAVASVPGPNGSDSTTASNGVAGDADLTALAGFATLDAAILEFDFVPNAGTVTFQYVFASEEYNEYVNSQFNDVFGFFVNGTNCATVGSPASRSRSTPSTEAIRSARARRTLLSIATTTSATAAAPSTRRWTASRSCSPARPP